MKDTLNDQPVRDRISGSLDETLVVEAAAGTGKTTELVKRILRVLATGKATVNGIVAVTFTEKSAGELKLRLRQELEKARNDAGNDAATRRRLEEAVKNLEDAHVSTIHGFCADLLRERPVEAGIDPLFTVLTDAQARRCYDEAFSAWLQDALEHTPEGVRRSLRRTSRPMSGGDADEGGPVERLRRAGWDLAEWRDFPASWTRPAFDREASIETLTEEVHAFAALTAQAASVRDSFCLDTAAARRASDELRLLMPARDHDAAEGVLVELRRDRDVRRARKGYGTAYGKGVSRADVHAAHQRLLQSLDGFAADADADLAALLRDELRDTIERYAQLKIRNGSLDFLDLLLRARNLIRDSDEVRGEFQQRFTSIFVDEFQDTDPLQAEILLLLASRDPLERDWTFVRPVPGKLFIVGDPKQSIYRFRRADVGTYRTVCDQLIRHGAQAVRLTTSFRSVPHIQRAVNAAFAPLMTGDPDTLQAAYVELSPSRAQPSDQPSVIALPVPEPYGKRNISGAAIEKSLPDAVGAFVDWLLNHSGWKVTERRSGGQPVNVEARHVCLLFRRFVSYGEDMTRGYVDALEARGIKHLLVGGRAFHDREEIETLRAALAAVEWPDDELSVFATLKGALFAIGDEELLEYRYLPDVRGFHPFHVPGTLPDHLAPIGEALRLLAALHRRRNRRPVAETIMRLLDATRAHVGFALRRAGEQVLANVLHVAELARQYELAGGISFRGFVDELKSAAQAGQAAEAPIVEEGSDGVRLMTVHKAKGLEFPVVILADMTAKLAPMEASRHLDAARGLCALRIGGWSPHDLVSQQATEHERERQEGIRVAYVAATRARDLLVVPAIGDQAYDGGWASPLDTAIYPAGDRRRDHVAAPGCPAFKKDSVLTRPDNGIAGSQTVCPGLHHTGGATPGSGFDVVWWDPASLQLRAEPPFGLRRQELISKDVSLDVVAEGHQRYKEWQAGRDAAIASAKTPSIRVQTVTEWAIGAGVAGRPEGRPLQGQPLQGRPLQEAEVVVFDLHPDRPRGVRYGTLVHAALATVPFDADAATLGRIVATQGRILAADADEMTSAAAVVRAVLAHPLMDAARRAAREGRCLRETPVTMTIDGTLVEGVVDCAFESEGTMVVIDFKTDRAEGELLARYARQVAFYSDAIARATSMPSRAVLMKI